MRILVTGSRDWPNDRSVEVALSKIILDSGLEPTVIVHGDCSTGADRIARDYARQLKALGRPVEEEAHPADWSTDRGAGLRRNQAMVDLGADVCVAFLGPCRKHPDDVHHSHGVTHCASRAALAGIKVVSVMKTY